MSLALVSAQPGMTQPTFVEQDTPFLDLRAGVNICVAAARPDRDCIPNDIRIGSEQGAGGESEGEGEGAAAEGEGGAPCMLLVTGPNMGGKSTILRQACLTTLMAHLGCHVRPERLGRPASRPAIGSGTLLDGLVEP